MKVIDEPGDTILVQMTPEQLIALAALVAFWYNSSGLGMPETNPNKVLAKDLAEATKEYFSVYSEKTMAAMQSRYGK